MKQTFIALTLFAMSSSAFAISYEGSTSLNPVVSTHTTPKRCSILLMDGTDSKIGFTDLVLADSDKVQVKVKSNFPAIHSLKIEDEWKDEPVYNQITGNAATPPSLKDHYVWEVRNVSHSKDFVIDSETDFVPVSPSSLGESMIYLYPEIKRISEGLDAGTFEVTSTIRYVCNES
ncbi:hypothetical protein [Vibrio harveyi]|uniref:hypothetical protein n=1 Tax=Vibrio harveyi TaxID=669 RepID=UPI003CE9B89E